MLEHIPPPRPPVVILLWKRGTVCGSYAHTVKKIQNGNHSAIFSMYKYSSPMEERLCELGDLKGVSHCEANFMLNDYCLGCCMDIYGPLDRGIAILQLCRWMFSHKETL